MKHKNKFITIILLLFVTPIFSQSIHYPNEVVKIEDTVWIDLIDNKIYEVYTSELKDSLINELQNIIKYSSKRIAIKDSIIHSQETLIGEYRVSIDNIHDNTIKINNNYNTISLKYKSLLKKKNKRFGVGIYTGMSVINPLGFQVGIGMTYTIIKF